MAKGWLAKLFGKEAQRPAQPAPTIELPDLKDLPWAQMAQHQQQRHFGGNPPPPPSPPQIPDVDWKAVAAGQRAQMEQMGMKPPAVASKFHAPQPPAQPAQSSFYMPPQQQRSGTMIMPQQPEQPKRSGTLIMPQVTKPPGR